MVHKLLYTSQVIYGENLCHIYLTDDNNLRVKITLWKEILQMTKMLGKYKSMYALIKNIFMCIKYNEM